MMTLGCHPFLITFFVVALYRSASSMIDHQLHSLLDNLVRDFFPTTLISNSYLFNLEPSIPCYWFLNECLCWLLQDSVSGDSSNGAHTPAVDDSFSFGALGGGILSMPRFPSPSPMLGAAGAGTSSATSAGSDGLQSFATMLASDSLNSSISSDPSPSADSRYISADLPDSMNTPIQGRQSITAGAVPETLESVEESFVEVMAETNTPEPPPLTSRPTRTDSGMMESFDASMDMDDTDSSILMDDTPSGMADILAL